MLLVLLWLGSSWMFLILYLDVLAYRAWDFWPELLMGPMREANPCYEQTSCFKLSLR